mmetsp:Transcript_4317/g.13084  ORF Transcript_4317/g.13084 Transcript_4317/m.13084 type:complete len:80 (+) Transcript_4317:187-426(+)
MLAPDVVPTSKHALLACTPRLSRCHCTTQQRHQHDDHVQNIHSARRRHWQPPPPQQPSLLWFEAARSAARTRSKMASRS